MADPGRHVGGLVAAANTVSQWEALLPGQCGEENALSPVHWFSRGPVRVDTFRPQPWFYEVRSPRTESEKEVPQEGTYLMHRQGEASGCWAVYAVPGQRQEPFIGDLIELALGFGQDAPPHWKAWFTQGSAKPHLSPVLPADTWLCWHKDWPLLPHVEPSLSPHLSRVFFSWQGGSCPMYGLSTAQHGWVLGNILGLCVTAESWGFFFFFFTNIQEHIDLLRIILFKVVVWEAIHVFFWWCHYLEHSWNSCFGIAFYTQFMRHARSPISFLYNWVSYLIKTRLIPSTYHPVGR